MLLIMIFSILGVSLSLAYWFFFKKVTASGDQHKRIRFNVRLYQERRAETEKDINQSFISQATANKLNQESARNLLHTVTQLESQHDQTHQKTSGWLWIMVLLPLLALPLYSYLGAKSDLDIYQDLNTLSELQGEDFIKAQGVLLLDIEKRLQQQQQPDNAEYRLMLARFYMMQENYAQAQLHFGMLLEIYPEEADLLANYVQASYLAKQRQLDSDTAILLAKALQINPKQRMALSLAGMIAFEQKDFNQALFYWRRLLAQLPQSSSQAKLIISLVAKAEQSTNLAQQELIVNVSLAPHLANLSGTLDVFVYVKPSQGTSMPIAVKKLKLNQLPLIVKLSDQDAMLESMRLSQFKSVVIGARVSQSGQPFPQPGDYQAEMNLIDWQAEKTRSLVIDQQIN